MVCFPRIELCNGTERWGKHKPDWNNFSIGFRLWNGFCNLSRGSENQRLIMSQLKPYFISSDQLYGDHAATGRMQPNNGCGNDNLHTMWGNRSNHPLEETPLPAEVNIYSARHRRHNKHRCRIGATALTLSRLPSHMLTGMLVSAASIRAKM